MSALIKMSSVDDEDLSGLRKFFDVTSHVRSLVNLGAESLTYGSSLCPVILEKLRNERVEVVEWNKMVPSLPLLPCELSVSVKENPGRKKK